MIKKEVNMTILVKHSRPSLSFLTGRWKFVDKNVVFFILEKGARNEFVPDRELRTYILGQTIWNDYHMGRYVKEEDSIMFEITIDDDLLIRKEFDNSLTVVSFASLIN